MAGGSTNIPDALREKFPHLRPTGVPTLATFNGCGVSIYGRRDYDEETQTYVKIHCICLLFIPIFFLGAYRVADAGPRSWYFLGRDSLSSFARSWNIALAALLLLGGLTLGWDAHTSSPEYRAGQEIARAHKLMQSGEVVQAAGIYRRQLDGPEAVAAREGFSRAVQTAMQSENPQVVAGALQAVAGLVDPIVPNASKQGLDLAAKFRGKDPDGALDILNATAAIEANDSIPPLRIDLLKTVIAADPGKTNRVVELAILYEAAGQLNDASTLLRPYSRRLGATEGARILGQRLLQEGNYSDAYGLLFPYVSTRLDKMRSAESLYTNIVASISEEALEDLRKGRAGESFYRDYENASEPQKQEMVNGYIETKMRGDQRFESAMANLKVANQIVPVTLDLGIVQLNRAQTLKDPAERKVELEAAEKTFLAIRSFAGESDEYRIFLGQVYYWLGRSAEGKELFDQILASNKRAFPVLMSLATTLRSVGETADARAMAEEAYRTAKSDQDKFAAAGLRATIFKDGDDQIAWLEKRDPTDTWTQIELNYARGRKARTQGNKTLAASLLHKAAAGYEAMPKSSTTLNNCGLAYFELYEATGNAEDHRRGMTLLEEAVALDPSNSILLHNTLFSLVGRAVMDVVGDAVHTEVLSRGSGLQVLSSLYRNHEEREKLMLRLKENEALKRALVCLDKALLLAPKDVRLYQTAYSLHAAFRDLPELQKLDQRFRIAAPDLKESRDQTLKTYSGLEDQKILADLQSGIQLLRGTLASPGVSNHPLSAEVINVSLLGLQQSCPGYGGTADSAALFKVAADTYRQHPSSASCQALKSVYLFRAVEELSRQNAEFKQLADHSRRALSPEHLICLVMERGGAPALSARKNQNVIKAVELEKQNATLFPFWANINQWALLRNVEPDLARDLASRIRKNDVIRFSNELEFRLNPVNATSVVDQYWTLKLLGSETQALDFYQAAVKAGVPLPKL